ncbi:required to maintain repression 2 [Zea mays]|uniref:Required to maintain repression 2 n=2 Tax=Zea mays TaxID=4577 RepID=C0P2Q9_MAIZE|nr:required to maintain repression 2 [Zea mays]ACN27275.1 unknown [Zea mays]ONM15400.1 required to maintain repression 2 [Zea mays]|eukprot:NP_001168161.1 required to maintain repression 2 [Zea mays]
MPVLRSPFAGGDLPAGDADPDYLYFLEHIRIDGDSYTLELPSHGDSPPSLIKYETPFASPSDGECVSDPSQGRLSGNRSAQDEREPVESASLETGPAWYDCLHDVDEDYRLFLQHTRVVDGQLVLEIGGVVVNYDNPVAVESPGEKDTQRGEEAVFASPGEGISVAAGSDQVASGAPATAVSEQNASDWRADPSPRREVNDGGDEGLSDASALKGAYWEASSSDGRRAPPTNSGGKVEKELGIIWPTHITRRPDSDFKRRLIKALTKPVARKEYYRLFDTVTIRTPLMKLRQVRNETKFYPTEEMGSSYLDHYPDLAEQIMNNGRRNGLALMRGFLFWLQNAVHEDQFKPWVDDSNKEHEVIYLVD